MKIAGTLLLLLALAPGYATAYIIDFKSTIQMDKDYGDPLRPERITFPFEVEGDTELRNFGTMNIWIDGAKLTADVAGKGQPGNWEYSFLNQWEATQGFDWYFSLNDVQYNFFWQYTEITGTPDQNPIEQFPNFAEGPWYFYIDDGDNFTQYGAVTPGPITAVPRQVPEPATLSLLALGLAAIGIRRRVSARLR